MPSGVEISCLKYAQRVETRRKSRKKITKWNEIKKKPRHESSLICYVILKTPISTFWIPETEWKKKNIFIFVFKKINVSNEWNAYEHTIGCWLKLKHFVFFWLFLYLNYLCVYNICLFRLLLCFLFFLSPLIIFWFL